MTKKRAATAKESEYMPRESAHTFAIRRTATGLGLCAENAIQRGDFIIEYYGIPLTREQSDEKGGKYLFEVSAKKVIDGSPRYNIARYLNHSCRPNCETDIVRGKIYIYAKRNIKSGEELTYDYGKEYVDDFIKPYGCKCEKCTQ